MKHKVRVTGWGYIEKYIEVESESEEEAVEKVESGKFDGVFQLWNGGTWKCIILEKIDVVEGVLRIQNLMA